jgi:hypothetical protein
MVTRYQPQAKSIIKNRYSNFGPSYGELHYAEEFIHEKKKRGIYEDFRIKKINIKI